MIHVMGTRAGEKITGVYEAQPPAWVAMPA